MRAFLDDNFLLSNEVSQRLYHQYAAPQPILDYHCHLPPKDIAGNRRFADLYEIWLEGDHYKWRAMRANGVAERYITGDASHYDKFLAWARTVPYTLRNPLYHWTHLELKRYFDIDELLNEQTAERIWQRANEQLQTGNLTTWNILQRFRVQVVCTSDDPAASLEHHLLVNSQNFGCRMFPTFRPDKALDVDQPDLWNHWLRQLEVVCNLDVSSLAEFLHALDHRHQQFHDAGGRLSD